MTMLWIVIQCILHSFGGAHSNYVPMMLENPHYTMDLWCVKTENGLQKTAERVHNIEIICHTFNSDKALVILVSSIGSSCGNREACQGEDRSAQTWWQFQLGWLWLWSSCQSVCFYRSPTCKTCRFFMQSGKKCSWAVWDSKIMNVVFESNHIVATKCLLFRKILLVAFF